MTKPPAYSKWYRARWREMFSEKWRRPWTMRERRTAIEMRARGKSYGQIAIAIKRTPDAVAAHLRALPIGEASR